MEILAKRLRERAQQLGISNAEAARKVGLEERRFAHYVAGRREPDLATLVRIAQALGTSPNWLLGVSDVPGGRADISELVQRFNNAAGIMTLDQLRLCVIQAEAVVRSQTAAET